MEFYLIVNGQQQGPFTIDELAQRGITPESEVWAEGMDDWKQAGDVPQLTEVLQQQQFKQHQAAAQQTSTPVGTPYQPAGTPPPPPQRAATQQAQEPRSSKGGCTRWLLALLILAILFATMVFTCPGRHDHEVAIEQVTQSFVNDKVEQKSPLDESGILGRMLNELLKNVAGYGTDMAVSHYLDVKNYLVCSVGRMSIGEHKDKMVSLGVFNHVFTFDKEDLEKAWAKAMDEYEAENQGILPPAAQQDEDTDDGQQDDDPGSDPYVAPDPSGLPDSILGVAVPEEMDSMVTQMANEAMRMAKEWAKKQIDELGH